MAFSYSALNNYGRATLPSVDSWSTNNNILRDPPKSITTRRINKVGETSSITSMIDDSSNRACEAINVFARGINPSVSVDYGNAGNNGGRNGMLTTGGRTMAFLPYTIAKDGAFRPPVVTQEELLPLSRLPRNWTSALSNPGFPDFSKRMDNCGVGAQKEIKDTLKACIRPTAVYKMETPLTEPFEVKYVIQPKLKIQGHSGIQKIKHVNNYNKETKNHIQSTKHAEINTNTRMSAHVNNYNKETKNHIQSTKHVNVISNPRSTEEKRELEHKQHDLERNVPRYEAATNPGTREVNYNISSRNYKLIPKIQPGGYEVKGQIPSMEGIRRPANNIDSRASEKVRMAKNVMSQHEARYLR